MRLLPGLPPFYGYREDSFVTPWSLRVMWDFYAHITPLSPLVGEQLWVMGYSSCHTLFISSQNSEESSSIDSDCSFSQKSMGYFWNIVRCTPKLKEIFKQKASQYMSPTTFFVIYSGFIIACKFIFSCEVVIFNHIKACME